MMKLRNLSVGRWSFSILTAFLITLTATPELFSQAARRPTPRREPAGAMSSRPDSNRNSVPKIGSRAEFDSVARVYNKGTSYAMPHVMFVIDRRSNDKVYFVNSQKFRFHKDFLLATYLVPRGADVFKPIYIDLDRRFIVGTIAWQLTVEKYTWELWEGDMADEKIIRAANEALNKAFYETLTFKPNSTKQHDHADALKLPVVTQDEINRNIAYLALNTGTAVGRIHIIDKLDDTVEIGDNEILILRELPLTLPPVRGIIVAKPSSPLSHINILAKGWNVPNVYIKDADRLFREYNTFVMRLEANLTDYKLEMASVDDLRDKFRSPDELIPPVDLSVKKLAGLREMRKGDSIRYGAKAANQGEMLNARLTGFSIPDGFSVPFYWYDKFMKDNGFDKIIEAHMDDDDFVHNPRYRRQKLDEFRATIRNGNFDEKLRAEVIERWKTQLGGKPVFVRSSSNSEDLPNFSGAGLYSSVANVIDENKLIDAVKHVWASLWKFEAYEARVRNYVSQTDVYMSVLIQLGVDMDRGGVMITRDPFDEKNRNMVYISSVCGHNSRVVDNSGVPEQLLFNPRNNVITVMTLSQQENALKFSPDGDLAQTADDCAGANRRVLTDAQVRNLGRIAMSIRRTFGGKKEQDIEWGIMNGKIFIVQSRPYIENK
jgi:hypothetical protein